MKKRMYGVIIFGTVCLAALIVYLAYLCVGGGQKQTAALIGSRQKSISLYTLKGTVYDKNLLPLTNGKTGYYLLIDPRAFAVENTQYLAGLCGENAENLSEKLTKESAFVVRSDEKPKTMRGVYVFEGVSRYQNLAAHLIGYVDGDMQGVTGLEKGYNEMLSYFGGSKEVSFVTDGRRNLMAGLGLSVAGQEGNYKDGLITTLDAEIQAALEVSLEKYVQKGAAVILDIQSGEVVASCSVPVFDAEHVEQYLQASEGELINRVLGEQTVGSVFKIVVSAAALEQGLGEFTMDCGGSITVAGRAFACPKAGGHGKMNLEKAFSLSCNGYFIALGQMLGTEKIMDMATRLGFGESIRLAEGVVCSGGVLPDTTGKAVQQLANLSIGQGELMASPVQIARLIAVCGNGGFLVHPTCFQGYLVDGNIKSEQWIGYSERVLEAEVAEKLREMCVSVVNEGTARKAKPDHLGAGGKTSSAQTGVFHDDGSEVLNTYFAGFYPAQQPRFAIAVFAQDGDSGGSTCAPVFKEICDFIYQNQK